MHANPNQIVKYFIYFFLSPMGDYSNNAMMNIPMDVGTA